MAHAFLLIGHPRAIGQVASAKNAAREQAVLLTNGKVLHGVVSRDSHRLTIETSSGGTVRLPVDQVERVSENVKSLFKHQRRKLPPNNRGAVLRLVDWCLENGLIEQAEDCLWNTARISPDDPNVLHTYRRLRRIMRAKAAGDEATSNWRASRLKKLTHAETPPTDHLDPNVLAQFTKTIQPLLVNSCAAATCHGHAASSKFQLRTNRRSRHTTLRNLESTLSWIDRNNVAESPLLIMALNRHGEPSVHEHSRLDERQFQMLFQWTTRSRNPTIVKKR